VLNYFNPHMRDRLEEGLVVAVEPIIAMKPARVQETGDGWTLRTSNGSFAAHFEHTVLITREGPQLLTAV
jgi:methionyl aminopeptidase